MTDDRRACPQCHYTFTAESTVAFNGYCSEECWTKARDARKNAKLTAPGDLMLVRRTYGGKPVRKLHIARVGKRFGLTSVKTLCGTTWASKSRPLVLGEAVCAACVRKLPPDWPKYISTIE